MMEVIHGDDHGLIKSWATDIEPEALEQIKQVSRLPFIFRHIAVMPDVHAGMGATIGSVIATQGAVIPAAVGVDIGCGMVATKTPIKMDDISQSEWPALREAIEQAVPHGRTNNGGEGDTGAWNPGATPEHVVNLWIDLLSTDYNDIVCDNEDFIGRNGVNALNHLGTLGTGNHFIELCSDDDDNVWIMLHSGSRGVGARIGNYFTKLAKDLCKKWFIELPNTDIAYLPEGTSEYDRYMFAASWAQRYARINRQIMLVAVAEALHNSGHKCILDDGVECHHNYATMENHFGRNVLVTRKGAICARKGVMGIIPGSMGAGSYIVSGKGNTESYCSASHGAGRKMSRTRARNTITIDEHRKATEGIECCKDDSVLDETPQAYKDISEVIEAQSDLVEVVAKLKQFICVKG